MFRNKKSIFKKKSVNENKEIGENVVPLAIILSFLTGGADKSRSYDLANLNPFRWPANGIRNIFASTLDKNKGIWIGKRAISGSRIYFSFTPGLDYSHWAVRINGNNYHLKLQDKSISNTIFIEIDEKNLLTEKFNWKFFAESSEIIKNKNEIENYIKENLNQGKYKAVPNDEDEKNCQGIVIDLIQFSTGFSLKKILLEYMVLIGSFLY